MAYDEHIFDRIDDMVEDMKSDWKTLFLSDDYGVFLSEYAKNLIAGVYDSLRAQGAKIPEGLLESEMKKFKLNRIFDPNAELKTAKIKSTFDQFEISVNGAGSYIQAVGTVEEKHEIVTGLMVHEVSHRLFTDFRVGTARYNQMAMNGQFYPIAPENIRSADGMQLQMALMQNKDMCVTVAKMVDHVGDATEDGYIENEITSHYPGLATSYLMAKNKMNWETAPYLVQEVAGDKPSPFNMVWGQWMLYARHGKLKLGADASTFDPDIMERIYDGMDVIDEIVKTRDPNRREYLNNQLGVMIYPLLRDEMDKDDKENNRKPQPGGSPQANQKMQQKMQNLAKQTNGNQSQSGNGNGNGQSQGQGNGGSGNQNSSQSIANPKRSMNSNLSQQVPNSGCRSKTPNNTAGNGFKPQANAPGGLGTDSSFDHGPAKQDLEDMLTQAAMNRLSEEAEKKRKKDMQKEADDMQMIESDAKPHIIRAEKVSLSNKQGYNKVQGKIMQTSKRLAQILLKKFKQYENDDVLTWQYSGSKFSSKQYCRDAMKGFQKSTLPHEVPNMYVYMLCDESGSVSGDLLAAEIQTTAIFEDFCRTLNIPLCVQGYTTGQTNLDIYSYVEEKKIDKNDKYRITGMQARGGTPTVGAMEYALNRIHKRGGPEHKLLFVITDGGAGDDDSFGAHTKNLLERAKKEKVTVIACGIGNDKASVENEFGSVHYLGIDDAETMPMRLLDVIRRNLEDVHK